MAKNIHTVDVPRFQVNATGADLLCSKNSLGSLGVLYSVDPQTHAVTMRLSNPNNHTLVVKALNNFGVGYAVYSGMEDSRIVISDLKDVATLCKAGIIPDQIMMH